MRIVAGRMTRGMPAWTPTSRDLMLAGRARTTLAASARSSTRQAVGLGENRCSASYAIVSQPRQA